MSPKCNVRHRAPSESFTHLDETNALASINDYRKLIGLDEVRNIKAPNSYPATVAITEIKGWRAMGVSTGRARELGKARANSIIDSARTDEILAEIGMKGNDFVTHAEAQSLIRAKDMFGELPHTVRMYVDRSPCNICQGGPWTYLGTRITADAGLTHLRRHLGVQRLEVFDLATGKMLVL